MKEEGCPPLTMKTPSAYLYPDIDDYNNDIEYHNYPLIRGGFVKGFAAEEQPVNNQSILYIQDNIVNSIYIIYRYIYQCVELAQLDTHTLMMITHTLSSPQVLHQQKQTSNKNLVTS
jgi:hypothetical protein